MEMTTLVDDVKIEQCARYKATSFVRANGLPFDSREDIFQDLSVALLQKMSQYDAKRASRTTFGRMVICRHLGMLQRRMNAQSASRRRDIGFKLCEEARADNERELNLTIDVVRVLRSVDLRDRRVALLLMSYRVVEVAQLLNISRSAVNRSIVRLRDCFGRAGAAPCR